MSNKSKSYVNSEIKKCINEQVNYLQITDKLSNVLSVIDENKNGKSTIDTINSNQEITINLDENANENKEYYYLLERYLMKDCDALKQAVRSDNQESPVSVSNNLNAQENYNKGILLSKKKEYKKAIKYYKKAVKIDPNFAFAWDNIGISYRYLNEYKKAISAYEKSLSIDPYGTMPLQNVAVAYIYNEDYKKAVNAYERLGGIYKSNPEVYYGLGRIYAINLFDYEKSLINMCKAYNIYTEQSSPYRTDAEKMILFIHTKMNEKGEKEQFNDIMKAHNINHNF